MSCSCEIHAEGAELVVVRRATGPDDAARLRATADRLVVAAHPGVVEVRSSSGDAEQWELRLTYAGRPVDHIGTMPAEQVAGVTAAVAAILADLHAGGIAHGRIDASHVLVAPHGRPVLCGFGPTDHPPAAEDDVAALGALITTLLGTDADLEPIPERRWRRRRPWNGWARRSLLLIADQASTEPSTRRPTARRLAAAIADAVPGATVIDLPVEEVSAGDGVEDPFESLRPTDRVAPHARRFTALLGAIGVVAALAVGALLLAARIAAAPTSASASASSPTIESPTTRPSGQHEPSSSTTDMPAPPPTTTSTTNPRHLAEITVNGTTVQVGARHYEVGQPGDLVVVGDWEGDGARTAALLRPGTGEVFVFPSWSDEGAITVKAITKVDGAVDLLVMAGGASDELVARMRDGSRYAIPRDLIVERQAAP